MANEDAEDETVASWRKVIQEHLSQVPPEYPDASQLAAQLRRGFYQELATTLQVPLNRYVGTLPHETYAEKQTLASWLNHELHDLGLSIRCPRTGRPAILVADVRDSATGASRFRLEVRDDNGRHVRTSSTSVLPQFELMQSVPRVEALAQWRKRPMDGASER